MMCFRRQFLHNFFILWLTEEKMPKLHSRFKICSFFFPAVFYLPLMSSFSPVERVYWGGGKQFTVNFKLVYILWVLMLHLQEFDCFCMCECFSGSEVPFAAQFQHTMKFLSNNLLQILSCHTENVTRNSKFVL
jgi:hypothetical protein